jgi:hypothetical protein
MYQKSCRLTGADKYYMGGGAPSVPQQDLGQELGQVLHYLPKFIGAQYDLSGKFGPKFAQQDIDLSRQFAPQQAQLGLDLTKQFGGQYAQAGFDIANKLSPQYQGLNLANMQTAIAGSPLLKEANAQVLGRLQQKGQLSPQEAYQDTQSSIAPFAGRGNVFNQAQAQSFLNRDALVRQRQDQALQQAQGLQASNLGTFQATGGAVQPPNYAGYAQAPNLAAYAAPGASYAPLAAGLGATSGQTNSLLGFGQNLFDANQNAAATQNIAAANKSGGLTGAGIGAAGAIGGGLLAAL